jgi:hypothetical protein
LESFEHNRRNRFEPAIRFVLEAKHGAKLLAEGNPEQKRDFLKKIGSNLRVAEKSLALISKTLGNSWRISIPRARQRAPITSSPSRE